MKKTTSLIVLLLTFSLTLSLSAHSSNGEDSPKSETRQLTDFNKVEIDFIGDVELVQSNESKVIVYCESEDVISKVITNVVSHKLTVTMQKNMLLNVKKLKVRIYSPHFVDVNKQGTGNLLVGDISGDNLVLTIGGTGETDIASIKMTQSMTVENKSVSKVEIRDYDAQTVVVNTSGAGSFTMKKKSMNSVNDKDYASKSVEFIIAGAGVCDVDLSALSAKVVNKAVGNITLNGTVENIVVKIYGVGNFKGQNLQVQNATLTHKAVGEIWLDVRGNLQIVESSGIGKMHLTSQGEN